MKTIEAFKIVLELAQYDVLTEMQTDGVPYLENERMRQLEAIKIINRIVFAIFPNGEEGE